jgi:hypothetical protein
MTTSMAGGGRRFVRSSEMIKRDLDLVWQRRERARAESGKQQSIVVNATREINKLVEELIVAKKDEAYESLLAENVS